jgi:hypothetical protein
MTWSYDESVAATNGTAVGPRSPFAEAGPIEPGHGESLGDFERMLAPWSALEVLTSDGEGESSSTQAAPTYGEGWTIYTETGMPYAETGTTYAETGTTYAETGTTYAETAPGYGESLASGTGTRDCTRFFAELRDSFTDEPAFGETGSSVGAGSENAMLRSAIRAGMTDENQLANLVFFRRHPERNGRLITRDEPNFSQLSREWMEIRDTQVGPALRDASGRPAPPTPTRPTPGPSRPTARNLVLISGGPGRYDDRDVEHDKSWANYVTPPLLFSDTPPKRAAFVGPATEVWWFVFRPAYLARWTDDVADSRGSVQLVRKGGFDSYAALLEARAQQRGWHLVWFQSADDLWTRLAAFHDPIERVWFWGHARDDLWLTLAHSTGSAPIRPPDSAVVTVTSIVPHAGLRSSFGPGRPHRFVGCNTSAFARTWSRVFGVAAEGVEGKVDFSAIHATGGDPALVGAARWLNFGTRVPQPAP